MSGEGINRREKKGFSFPDFFSTSDTDILNSEIRVKKDINRLDQNSIRYRIWIKFDLVNTLELR